MEEVSTIPFRRERAGNETETKYRKNVRQEFRNEKQENKG